VNLHKCSNQFIIEFKLMHRFKIVTCGSLVPLASQEGKGDAVAEFLLGGYGLVQAEPETLQWYAMKLEGTSPVVYDIFDTFPSQEGRKAHFDGPIPNALMQHGPSLLSVGPDINKIMVDVVASKVTKAGEGQKAGLTVGSRVLFTAKPEKKQAVRESLIVGDAALFVALRC
jgi:hypothetical protein